MAALTWNFPVYQAQDRGPGQTRNQECGVFSTGPGSAASTAALPFTETLTAIFPFFFKTGWTDTSPNMGLFSIGSASAAGVAALRFAGWDGAAPHLSILASNASAGTVRYSIAVGDEDGASWLQADKWYQFAVSFDGSGITYAVNGGITPKESVGTNSPGTLDMDNGSERIWMFGASANHSQSLPEDVSGAFYPSYMTGASACSTQLLDLTDSTVLGRIFDANGDFKNPGEDGSLWFGDTYGDNQPEYYFANGAPYKQLGTNTLDWVVAGGGNATGKQGNPGGLKKMYE